MITQPILRQKIVHKPVYESLLIQYGVDYVEIPLSDRDRWTEDFNQVGTYLLYQLEAESFFEARNKR